MLTPPRTLDLDALDRVFTIRSHDALAGALGAAAGGGDRRRAPASRSGCWPSRRPTSPTWPAATPTWRSAAAGAARPEIAAETIGADQMVAIFRAGHPLADGELTPERLAAADHVTVSRRGRLHGVIDDALAERGLSRRVVAALPTSSAALDLAARTDLVTTVAEQVCRPVWTRLGLVARPFPFPVRRCR